MCLFIILLFFGPRTVIVFWWLVQPLRWDATFHSFLLPFLGFLFLAWSTLMYVLVAPVALLAWTSCGWGWQYSQTSPATQAVACTDAGAPRCLKPPYAGS